MRWMRILVVFVPMLGFAVYRFQQKSASEIAAAALIDSSFAPSWSTNEQMVSAMEEKLKQDPDNVKANAMLGQAYLQRARENGDPGFYTKAEILFERALKKQPRFVEALLGKASLLMARHNFREAQWIAMKAIETDSDVVASYGILTDALVQLGEYDDAIRTLETMVRRKPNLSSYSRVSYIRELHGDTEGAIQAMKMAIDSGAPHAENTAWCMVQLGNLYSKDGKWDEAAEQYQFALIRFPEYAHAIAGLARVAEARGDLTLAVEHYRNAMDRIPLPEFAIALAHVYQRMGRNDDAQAHLDLVDAIQKLYEANGVSAEANSKAN